MSSLFVAATFGDSATSFAASRGVYIFLPPGGGATGVCFFFDAFVVCFELPAALFVVFCRFGGAELVLLRSVRAPLFLADDCSESPPIMSLFLLATVCATLRALKALAAILPVASSALSSTCSLTCCKVSAIRAP